MRPSSWHWSERAAFVCALLIEAVTLVFCLVSRPSPLSLLAPVLGPWAGYLYGHESCTMATVLPAPSWGALTSLLLAGAGLVATRHSRLRPLATGFLALTLALWCTLALLSVANSLE